MRVFHLRNSHLLGGPERLLLDQGRRAAPGYQGTLASFARREERSALLEAAGLLGLETLRVAQAGSYDPRVVRRVRRLLRDGGYDLVVGHDYKANLVLALAGRGLGLPRVAVVHGYTGEDSKVRLFEAIDRRLLRAADAVVTVSRAAVERLALAGVPAARLHCIPNGIDAERVAAEAAAGRAAVRAEWGCGARDVVVLAMGRLSREKNHRLLIEVLGELAGDPRLVILGEGPARRELEEACWQVGVAGRVRLPGWRDDATRCLGAADLFVLPSLREGLPLALLEAMAAGLPVVATRVGGVPELLGDGEYGVLVPPGDSASLRAALQRLLDDVPRRAALGARGRLRVREAFGIAGQTRALEDLYASLAAARQAPA